MISGIERAFDYETKKSRREGFQEGMGQGLEQGIEQGLERGKASEKKTIARRLAELGMDPRLIQEATGLTEDQKKELADASKIIPVFFSANMSLGINLLIRLAKQAAKILEGSFDIEIIEKHHNKKIDAPSGTALAIADGIAESLSNKPEYVYERHSVRKPREKQEIGLHAVRGGTIVGEHEVLFAGPDEVISLSHSAQSRDVFAQGAVRAAKFLSKKSVGFYSMDDLFYDLV